MIVRRRKHKRSHLNRPRGRHGQFVKTRRHRGRRPHRRRANPGLIVANPRRRRRRSPMVQYHHPSPRRRRRLRRRGGLHYRRRRSNPSMGRLRSLGSIARVGLFGGLGIITARIGGYLYTTYAATHVIGDETDTGGWRHTLNEVLRLVAMGAVTVGVERGLTAVGLMRRPQDRQAFFIGGMAEAGRQAVGLVVKRLSPDSDLEKYGLSGYSEFSLDQGGNIYGLSSDDGQWYLVGSQGMGGLVDADNFGRMSGLTAAENFGNVVVEKRFDNDNRR